MRRAVAFYLPVNAFDDLAELRPFCEILEVEANVVGFSEVVEIGGGEFEEVVWAHGANCRHLCKCRL